MSQTDSLARLLNDLHSASDEAKIAAAKGLLELGEYGSPAGSYLLVAGRAALRTGLAADAAVLLYHGLRVAEPNTEVWGKLLVNRAIACAQHGFTTDAIELGERFLAIADTLGLSRHLPYAHHAIAFASDRDGDFRKAVPHYRLAAQLQTDPVQRAIATADLAYALVRAGLSAEADQVLAHVDETDDPFATFVRVGTTSIVRCHQHRFAEALSSAELAEALAIGHEDAWAIPVGEVHLWMSRSVLELGDRPRAIALALRAHIVANQHSNSDLARRASTWVAEIMDKGGIQ